MDVKLSEWAFWGLQLFAFKYPDFLIHALFMNYYISHNTREPQVSLQLTD